LPKLYIREYGLKHDIMKRLNESKPAKPES
jgi:hypothetical protein